MKFYKFLEQYGWLIVGIPLILITIAELVGNFTFRMISIGILVVFYLVLFIFFVIKKRRN